jgi:hypothetical protein
MMMPAALKARAYGSGEATRRYRQVRGKFNLPLIYTTVFFVTESEYAKLQIACPDDFPFTYPEFVAQVDAGTAILENRGYGVRRIEARVDDFLAWCKTARREPDDRARAAYASMIGSSRPMN